MWTLNVDAPSGGSVRATVAAAGRTLTNAEIVEAWRGDEAFADFWSEGLAALPFDACCWEMPPLIETTWPRPFECMVFDNPELDRMRADPVPFQAHFTAAGTASVVAFRNLSGDALLVAPCPVDDAADYTHLAAFLRTASRAQARGLWAEVAGTMRERAGDGPLWVSTAGLGVAWLHVRVSSVPKYYRCRAYAEAAQPAGDGAAGGD